MPDIMNSLYNIRLLDSLARKETPVHGLHPLAKVLVTLIFLMFVVSFDRYEIIRLMPFFLYPVIIFMLSDIPAIPFLKRILLAMPFVIGIGILNPLFDKQTLLMNGVAVSRGWLSFFSILIKSVLTIASGILLIATTGMDKLAAALRMLKIPKILVLQLLLTYRYISILMEEVARTIRAYSLRTPMQKGIHRSAWGSLAGQLLIRTYDRGQRVYHAMCLRGFTGEYNTGDNARLKIGDYVYLLCWILFFVIVRSYNIPLLIESLLTGVIR